MLLKETLEELFHMADDSFRFGVIPEREEAIRKQAKRDEDGDPITPPRNDFQLIFDIKEGEEHYRIAMLANRLEALLERHFPGARVEYRHDHVPNYSFVGTTDGEEVHEAACEVPRQIVVSPLTFKQKDALADELGEIAIASMRLDKSRTAVYI
jgi:hypothetical protein